MHFNSLTIFVLLSFTFAFMALWTPDMLFDRCWRPSVCVRVSYKLTYTCRHLPDLVSLFTKFHVMHMHMLCIHSEILPYSITFSLFSSTLWLLLTGQQQYFRVKPRDKQIIEGKEEVELECHVSNVMGQVQWSKDGFLLGKYHTKALEQQLTKNGA